MSQLMDTLDFARSAPPEPEESGLAQAQPVWLHTPGCSVLLVTHRAWEQSHAHTPAGCRLLGRGRFSGGWA